jgi:hypothetical protein
MRRMLLLVVVALALAALAAPAHAHQEPCIINCINAATATTTNQ